MEVLTCWTRFPSHVLERSCAFRTHVWHWFDSLHASPAGIFDEVCCITRLTNQIDTVTIEFSGSKLCWKYGYKSSNLALRKTPNRTHARPLRALKQDSGEGSWDKWIFGDVWALVCVGVTLFFGSSWTIQMNQISLWLGPSWDLRHSRGLNFISTCY